MFPYLEQKLTLLPHRVLAGHSLAGVYVLHTLLSEPELFQAYVASSPSLRSPERRAVIQSGLEGIDPARCAGRFVFISAGGMESPELVAGVEEAGETLKSRQQLSLQAVWGVYPGEGTSRTRDSTKRCGSTMPTGSRPGRPSSSSPSRRP